MATKFLEPGGDATSNIASTTAGGFWSQVFNTPTIGTDFVHGNHISSLQFTVASFNWVATPAGTANDTGTRISAYYYFKAFPSITTSITDVHDASISNNFFIKVTTSGVLQLFGNSTQLGSDGPTLVTGKWYRISLAFVNTGGSNYSATLFVDGVSVVSVTNTGTGDSGASYVRFGVLNGGDTTLDFRVSDIYIDDSSSLMDPGDIWVTAKRPNANGTTNGFTTQIGSGGSGYGSGHSPQVNERPLSTTNGWSMIGAGSAVTEEYNIEGASVGDINISNNRIIDFMGWVYASAALSETGQIIVAGVNTNISLTSTNTMFTQAAGSSTYPAGGTDIGIITSTTVTTVSLYECGIIVAFIANPQNTSSDFFDFMGPAQGYNNA